MHKVVILTSAHHALDVRIFHKQAKSLAKAGYNVTLIAQSDKSDKNETIDGVKIICLPKPRNRLQRMLGLTSKILFAALKEKADVYHFHDPELLPIGLLLKLLTHAKVIYDIHENVKKQILTKTWIPVSFRKFISYIYVLFETIVLKFIDYVIIAEDSYIENYKNYNNLSSVRNYPMIEYGKAIEQRKPDYRTGSNVLIYVGVISKERGAIEAIESLNILIRSGYTNIYLKLIGPIPLNFKQELVQLAERYKLTSHISIPGVINHKEVFGELIRANIGLAILYPIPNYLESLPTKLFEYMFAMLPVIASNFPLWKEIVEGNNCGLTVDPMNPKEIAKAIEYLLERPDLMEEMGRNGKKAVLEKYNWEQESAKLLDIYNNLLTRL